MVTLKTFGGLANRMRVIDSSFQLCKKKGIPLKVIWEMSSELNCSFHKLFSPLNEFNIDEYYIGPYKRKFRNLTHRMFKSFNIYLPLGYKHYIFDADVETAKRNNTEELLFDKDGFVYISTVHQFYQASTSFNYLNPVDELQSKINKLKDQFSSNTIGIHIRRSDNTRSIQHSPLQVFVDRMNREIESKPDTKFFLATDSPDEEKFLKNKFPERVITFPKNLSRNTEEGIQDALVDLYGLSGTKKIIGSYYSSFSEVAAQLGHIPIDLIFVPA